MILRICGLILPSAKREVFEEAWAADLEVSPKHSLARFLLGIQFLVASLKIRAANDSTQLLKLLGAVAIFVPVVAIYFEFSVLREPLIGFVFLIAYQFRNLAAKRFNRALAASAVQMFIATAFLWSRGFLVRDSVDFYGFWQSFGILPNWVPIGLGILTLVSAVAALSLWMWTAINSDRLSLIEKALFSGVLATGFPQLLWEVSYSIQLMDGMFLAESAVVAISQLQHDSSNLMSLLVLAGAGAWLTRKLLIVIRANRAQYRSPRTTSTSDSQTVDA